MLRPQFDHKRTTKSLGWRYFQGQAGVGLPWGGLRASFDREHGSRRHAMSLSAGMGLMESRR
jgi:hypothetical protein